MAVAFWFMVYQYSLRVCYVLNFFTWFLHMIRIPTDLESQEIGRSSRIQENFLKTRENIGQFIFACCMWRGSVGTALVIHAGVGSRHGSPIHVVLLTCYCWSVHSECVCCSQETHQVYWYWRCKFATFRKSINRQRVNRQKFVRWASHHCWLGGRKGIRPIKNEWWDVGMVICLGRGADLHMAQLMPLPLTISCSNKSGLDLPSCFYLSGTGSPE